MGEQMSQWYDDRNNLADLWNWLVGIGDDPDPADFIEKPWKWTPEWEQFLLAFHGGDADV